MQREDELCIAVLYGVLSVKQEHKWKGETMELLVSEKLQEVIKKHQNAPCACIIWVEFFEQFIKAKFLSGLFHHGFEQNAVLVEWYKNYHHRQWPMPP